MHIVRADGRGSQLRIPAGWTSVSLVLAGAAEADAGWCAWRLEKGQMMVWTDGALGLSARGACWWLVVAAPANAWSAHGHRMNAGHDLQMMPWQAPCTPDVKRAMVRLARRERGDAPVTPELLGLLTGLLLEQQHSHVRQWLSRSSGRTLQRKQQSLLRLLRVRRIVRSQPEARLDLASLASYANYSPHHLIRVYRNVFGETPAEYALRLRTRKAWQLVRETTMPICEITELLGFESQSAFCRSFKHSFGMTTSQARRLVVAHPVRIGGGNGADRGEQAIAA
jgi:AraC-like DNA-binding protein